MKHYFVIIILLLCTITCFGQSSNIKVKGRVYLTSVSNQSKIVTNNYLTDFKVLLIKIYATGTDMKFVEANKQKFCSDNKQILERYPATADYTNSEGFYEFTDLQPNSYYMLILCDRKIQVSLISTGAKRSITYKVKDKQVAL